MRVRLREKFSFSSTNFFSFPFTFHHHQQRPRKRQNHQCSAYQWLLYPGNAFLFILCVLDRMSVLLHPSSFTPIVSFTTAVPAPHHSRIWIVQLRNLGRNDPAIVFSGCCSRRRWGWWSVFVGIGAHKITIGDEINEKINDVEKWHRRTYEATYAKQRHQCIHSNGNYIRGSYGAIEPLEVDGITRGGSRENIHIFRHWHFTKM